MENAERQSILNRIHALQDMRDEEMAKMKHHDPKRFEKILELNSRIEGLVEALRDEKSL